ncbi:MULTISPECIES: ABC transporter permease [unclassified Pseudomonas]|uniref:ABC transporter permease n=1 Tax=unclassified Pseudomonas TaxID=196821 RepID=UPI00131FA4E7|nr:MULTISPECIES: ABC transporter permease [unclassified Pseudomonas]NWA86253.1 ABC transporter permease [Pseudomonas sp. D2002]QHD08375.1 sugar ABC transporter permease [Pseudomonas sp. R76]
MNPHAPAPISLLSLLKSVWANWNLIQQMTKRDVIGRYKGSMMGILWSFANPILLLVIYTLVFSVVFKARWGTDEPGSKSEFAILLFTGMIVHSLFAETLTRAPTLILSNISYVKKVVFPLEILPIIAMGTSFFHALVSIGVLLVAQLLVNGAIPWTVVFLPLVIAPLIVLSLGLAWILASLGVYLRDVAHPIGLLMTLLLFASPVFYPISALPVEIQPWLMLNPLTFIIEQARGVLISGSVPDFTGLAIYAAVAVSVAWAGYSWFQKTRKGFANVL